MVCAAKFDLVATGGGDELTWRWWVLVEPAGDVLLSGGLTGDSIRLLTFWLKSMLNRGLLAAGGVASVVVETGDWLRPAFLRLRLREVVVSDEREISELVTVLGRTSNRFD